MSICEKHIFKSVFEQMQPKIQRFLRSKGLDLDSSADLTQDVFTKLWQNCSKVKEEKALSYLFTIANNLIIDKSRKEKTKLKYLGSISQAHDSNDPECQLRMVDFKKRLESAIDSMAAGSKEVFMMSRFNDMKYREIAEALGLSVKAVEKRMSIALKHLVDRGIIKKR